MKLGNFQMEEYFYLDNVSIGDIFSHKCFCFFRKL